MELATVARLYEPFFRRLTKNDDFRFNLHHPPNIALVTKFLDSFSPPMGKLTFINYLAYQAWVWKDMQLTSLKELNHTLFFGKQAITRYKGRDQANNWLADETLNDLKISKHLLLKSVEETPYYDPKAVQLHEEGERKRFLNQPMGFKHCLDFTSMYHPESPTCQACVYRTECRAVVLANFPAIAKKRKLRKEETEEKKALKASKNGSNPNPNAQRGLFN